MLRLQNILLSKTDFDNSHWHKVIDSIADKTCEHYVSEFSQKARAAQSSGDSVAEEVFTLLCGICSLLLEPDTPEVFHPYMVFYDPPMRGFVLDDFTSDHIAVLAEVVADPIDADMRARLADAIWMKGRGKYYPMVQLAVEAYLESAKRTLILSQSRASRANLRFKRALSLAKSVRNRDLLDFAMIEVEKTIFSHDEKDLNFPFPSLLRLLLDCPSRNCTQFSELAERLAKASEALINWMDAQIYWQIKADWDHKAGNTEDERAALIQVAEAHVKVGEFYANQQSPQYSAACFQLERAMEILRGLGGMRRRCEEIHNTILEYQQLHVDSFQLVSMSVEIDSFVQHARQRVKGQTLSEAILTLAFAERPAQKQAIRTQVEGYLKDTSFHTLFPMAMVDDTGRRIASTPSILNATEDEKEKTIKSRMFMESTTHQQLVAVAHIEPTLVEMQLEHKVQMDDLAFIVRHNHFIPPDHASIFLKGLYAGFQGDYLIAAHLLVPQIENSLRYILNQRRVITSSLNTQTGIQENHGLEKILDMSELEQILGEDIVFDLQCLLIGRFGSNLRNRLSHGLMSSAEFSSPLMMYLWWLVLHLCCHGLPLPPSDEQGEQKVE